MVETATHLSKAIIESPTRTVEIRALSGDRSLLTLLDGRNFVVDRPVLDLLSVFEAIGSGHNAAAPNTIDSEDFTAAVATVTKLLREAAAFMHSASVRRKSTRPDPSATEADVDAPMPWSQKLVITGDSDLAREFASSLEHRGGAMGSNVEIHPGPLHTAVHRAFSTDSSLIVATRGADSAGLIDADRLCSDARISWCAATLERNQLRLGPVVSPSAAASYEDYVARRIAAAPDAEVERALLAPSITGDGGAGPSDVPDLLSMAAALVLTSAPLSQGGTIISVASTGETRIHPVLPLPGSDRPNKGYPVASLIDEHTGLITRTRQITHHPSVPKNLTTVQADVCTLRRVSRWANNTSCQGSAFDNPQAAEWAAIGEAVERYCGNILDTLPLEFGSYRDLTARRVGRVLNPDDVILYSDAQYDAPGFPFVRLTHDLPIHWVPGRSLTTEETIWVPASLVYVNWFTAGFSSAPVTNFCPFAGIAAGPSLEYATMSALEEIIERHATMVWWINRQPLDALKLDQELLSPWQDSTAQGQQPSIIPLDNEFKIPVAAGVLQRPEEGLLNIGFSARHDISTAAKKAWTEALTLQEGSRDLLPENGRHWAAIRRGDLNGRSFKPWRADRCYLDDFREDMHDCDDLMVQQQVYLDPRAQNKVRDLTDRPVTRGIADIPRLPSRTLRHYQQRVEEQGLEVIVVDITSTDVASTGFSAARVIVPGTIGNAPAAFPFLGRGRLQQIAVELGWRDTPLAEEDLNYFPLPHA